LVAIKLDPLLALTKELGASKATLVQGGAKALLEDEQNAFYALPFIQSSALFYNHYSCQWCDNWKQAGCYLAALVSVPSGPICAPRPMVAMIFFHPDKVKNLELFNLFVNLDED